MRRIWGFAALAAMLAVFAPAAKPTPVAATVIYAHRGGAAHAPENTLAAFERTEALFGARNVWLEMDTQATSDGTLVIIHDDSLDRTTDCTGKVNTRTIAQVSTCNAAAKFPGWTGGFVGVPTLEEVLTRSRDADWKLMIEIKDIPGEANFDPTGQKVADSFIKLVKDLNFPTDRLLIQSFWPPALERVEQLDPTIGTVLLTTSQLPGAPPGAGFTLAENAAFAAARNFEVSSADIGSVDYSAASVAAAHGLGRRVVPWTIDDAATMRAVQGYGVDGIITNDPDLAYTVLGG